MKKFLLTTMLIFPSSLLTSSSLLNSPSFPFLKSHEERELEERDINLYKKLVDTIRNPKLEAFIARMIVHNFEFLINTGNISNRELNQRVEQVWHANKKEYFDIVIEVLRAELKCEDLFTRTNLLSVEYLTLSDSQKKQLVDLTVDNMEFKDDRFYEASFKSVAKHMNKTYQLYKKQRI